MNPRFATFCRVTGFTPLTKGQGHLYVIWISQRWAEWKRATDWRGSFVTHEDHAAFDAWLASL